MDSGFALHAPRNDKRANPFSRRVYFSVSPRAGRGERRNPFSRCASFLSLPTRAKRVAGRDQGWGALFIAMLKFSAPLNPATPNPSPPLRGGRGTRNIVLALRFRIRVLPTTTTTMSLSPSAQDHAHEKRESGAPRGALFSQCPRRRQVYAVCVTHLRFARRVAPTAGETPPFGAHACGTRHRLSPRWLSSRTGFPAAVADRCFACFAHTMPRLSTLRADQS